MAPRAAAPEKGRLRFLTCGSVDDGKSTLIGRLLYETMSVLDDELAYVERERRRLGGADGELDFSLLVDGLEAEREQGITIDVAYRYFSTPRRSFIVADTPGHEQYTRNMATGASGSDAAVILIDARKGVLPQTRRHSHICAMLGIRHVVVAVNKIDLVDYSGERFHHIVGDYLAFAEALGFASITAIPLSARNGDNVATRSAKIVWYDGPALLEVLEDLEIESARERAPLRFPVQWVNRPNLDFRGFSGTVASGVVRVGDPVVVAASGLASTVARIVTADGDLPEARAGDAVTLTLADEIDVARGDVFSHADARPAVERNLAADVLWMAEEPMVPGRGYLMRIGMRFVPARVTKLKHKVDVNTLEHVSADALQQNEIAACHLATAMPVAFDRYADNRETGAFILIDRFTNATVGAGMITAPLDLAANVHPQSLSVDRAARAERNGHRAAAVWLTGLSGAGKSTIADLVERELHRRGVHTYVLDGDNVRLGLSADLGFGDADRVENVRRVAEVARLFVDAGLVVLCSVISPFAAERARAREVFDPGDFLEVFVDAPLEVCAARDPKGLYRLAREGKVDRLTGVASAYERPSAPDLVVRTDELTAEAAADQVVRALVERGVVR